MRMPASAMNSSAAMWVPVPMPEVAKVSSPGRRFASATSVLDLDAPLAGSSVTFSTTTQSTEAQSHTIIITTPRISAPIPTTATAPKPRIVTLLPSLSVSQSTLAYWISP